MRTPHRVTLGVLVLFCGAPAAAAPIYAIAQDLDISEFWRYSTVSPYTVTLINNNFSPLTVYGIDFDQAGTLWGVNNADLGRSYGTINTSTGVYSSLGPLTGIPMAEHISGLAINHNTGVFYVSTSTATGFTVGPSDYSALYTLNPATGAATLIGTEKAAQSVQEIAFDAAGDLFAIDAGTQSLYSMSSTTAAVSLIGSIQGVPDGIGGFLRFRDMTGMKFDLSTGILYAVLHADPSDGALVTINPANGSETVLNLGFGGLTEEIAIPSAATPEPGSFWLLTAMGIVLVVFGRRLTGSARVHK